jgi:predicted DNA-binding transcriptional regulator AlpA
MEETIRQIVREENEKHLEDIKCLLKQGHNEKPRFLTVSEAAKTVGLGKTAIYELCRQSSYNGFPCIKETNKLLIPYTSLIEWMEQRANQAI